MRWNGTSSCIVTDNFKHFSAKSIENTDLFQLKAHNLLILSALWRQSMAICYIIIRVDALRSLEWMVNCVKDYWHAIVINAHLMWMVPSLQASGNDLNLKSLLLWVASSSSWTSSSHYHFKYFSIALKTQVAYCAIDPLIQYLMYTPMEHSELSP